MSIIAKVNSELVRLQLEPLVEDQLACLQDPLRLEEAAGMLCDLRDRCGVGLPLPQGVVIGGPFADLSAARDCAEAKAHLHGIVAVDEIAADESRSSGTGNEFYVTGFDGSDAALALAENASWVAMWVRGAEQVLP